MRKRWGRLFAVGVAALAAMLGLPARAAVIVTDFEYSPAEVWGGIVVGSTDFGAVPAGRFLSTIKDLDTQDVYQLYTFCVDVVNPYQTYSPFTLGSLSSMNAVKQAQLAALLVHSSTEIGAAADKSTTGAAFALAVWEVVYEASNSGYTLGSGNFSTYGNFAGASILADGYLANLNAGTWQGSASRLGALISDTGENQNQIYLLSGGVPEPTTWALMIVGLGLAGAAMRRARGRAMQPLLAV